MGSEMCIRDSTIGWVPSLIPFPCEHSFKNLGVWYDTVLLPGQASRQYSKLRTDIASSARLLRTRKASPRLTAAVLRSALLPKSAYPSVLSSWSLTDLQEFDRIFASQYRLLAKDSSTSQHDALFQPRAQGGMGFPRFSHLVIERKNLPSSVALSPWRTHTPAGLPNPSYGEAARAPGQVRPLPPRIPVPDTGYPA